MGNEIIDAIKRMLRGIILAAAFLMLLIGCDSCFAEAAEATKLKLNMTSVVLEEGGSAALKVQGYIGKKKASSTVDFSSSNTAVVSIEQTKKHTVILKAHKAGKAIIRVTARNGKTVKCKVTVKEKPIRLALVDTGWNINAANLCGVFRARGISVTLINRAENANPQEYDGLLIPGGADVNPNRYGEGFNGSARPDDGKDALQLNVIRQFAAAGKPMFGVCRGCQILNVAFGGSLQQHIDHHRSNVRWIVNTKKSIAWRMFGEEICVAHFHHQAVKRLADGFLVIQRDKTDGTIEGIYNPRRHIYGYQWHPEISGEVGGIVVDEFLKICREAR